MLQRVSEQRAAIAAVLIEGKVQYLMPEGEEWTIIVSSKFWSLFKRPLK